MQINKVEICGVNTSKLDVIDKNEFEHLLERSRNGDKSAREKLICGNLKLVLSVIQRFGNRGENPDDLFQVGCIGLIKAVDNFDSGHDVRFSTYAVPMIIGEIRRYLRDNNMIRVSRSVRDTAYKAITAKEQFINENQREPTVEELSQITGVAREELVTALDAIMDPISLFDPVYTEGGDAIYVMDQISDVNNTDDSWVDELSFRDALKELNSREKKILSMRFFNGKTQTEVADEIGISQAQVSRLEKSAINRIKKKM